MFVAADAESDLLGTATSRLAAHSPSSDEPLVQRTSTVVLYAVSAVPFDFRMQRSRYFEVEIRFARMSSRAVDPMDYFTSSFEDFRFGAGGDDTCLEIERLES